MMTIRFSRRKQIVYAAAYLAVSACLVVAILVGVDYPLVGRALSTGIKLAALGGCLVGLAVSVVRAIQEPIAMSLDGHLLRLRGVSQRIVTMPVESVLSFHVEGSVVTLRTRSGRFVLRGLGADAVVLVSTSLEARGIREGR